MTIGLISDTHGLITDDVLEHLRDCAEVWHGGDLGKIGVIDQVKDLGVPLRTIYGNIDGKDIRAEIPLNQEFEIDGLKVFMTHIGGYPGRYTKRVKEILTETKPDIYICGHSHICKVVRDKKLGTLHMNPGACGHIGFHSIRTMLKFEILEGKIENLRAVELGMRGVTNKDWTG